MTYSSDDSDKFAQPMVLTGTAAELPGLISSGIDNRLSSTGGGSGDGTGSDSEWIPNLIGKIALRVYFIEGYTDWKQSLRPSLCRSSFKIWLMNEDFRTIDLAKMQFWAERVHSELHNYTINRGKITVTYADPSYGYRSLYSHFATLVDGENFWRRIVAIQEHPFQMKNLFYSQNVEAGVRYPDEPRKEEIASHEVKTPVLRPTCKIHFYKAALKLPHTKTYYRILSYDSTGKVRIISKLPTFITRGSVPQSAG